MNLFGAKVKVWYRDEDGTDNDLHATGTIQVKYVDEIGEVLVFDADVNSSLEDRGVYKRLAEFEKVEIILD